MQVKTTSEAFSLFDRWREGETLLRVDFRTSFLLWDVEGRLDRVEAPLIGLRLGECGFIEFTFDTAWRFDFAALDAVHVKPEERLGQSSSNAKTYEFGEIIWATRTDDPKWQMRFHEIVRRLT